MNTPRRLPVFFDARMAVEQQHFAPGADKPRLAVEDWIDHDLAIAICDFEPASLAQLYAAHDRAYVDGVLAGRISNGFANRSPSVAATLPWTSGSMRAAARHAWRHGGISCSPTSGFHHAHHDASGGYCTFNGLLVAALDLLREAPELYIAILDFDMHYGDGTDQILRTLGLQGRISHVTAGRDFDRGMGADFMDQLYLMIDGARIESQGRLPDLMLYQAGADPHLNDPLGGMLSDQQLEQRDAEVFRYGLQRGVPIAFNLAGGYQRDARDGISPVLAIHRRTVEQAVAALNRL